MLTTQRCGREGCNRILAAPAFASKRDLQANKNGYCSESCAVSDNQHNERKDA